MYTVDIGLTVHVEGQQDNLLLVRPKLTGSSAVPLLYDAPSQPLRMHRKFGWYSNQMNSKKIVEPVTNVATFDELTDFEIDTDVSVINPIKKLVYSPLKHVWIAHSKVGTGISSNNQNAKYMVDTLAQHLQILATDGVEAAKYVGGVIRFEIRFEANVPFSTLNNEINSHFIDVMEGTQWIALSKSDMICNAQKALRDFIALELLSHRNNDALQQYQQEALAHLCNKCGISVKQCVQFLYHHPHPPWTARSYTQWCDVQLRWANAQRRVGAAWEAERQEIIKRAEYAKLVEEWERDHGESLFAIDSWNFCYHAIATRDHPINRKSNGEPRISLIKKNARGAFGCYDSKEEAVRAIWDPANPTEWMCTYRIDPSFAAFVNEY